MMSAAFQVSSVATVGALLTEVSTLPTVAAANSLSCGASNVLMNIALP